MWSNFGKFDVLQKSVNKLYFEQKLKKWAKVTYFVYSSNYFVFIKCHFYQGESSKLNFSIKDKM